VLFPANSIIDLFPPTAEKEPPLAVGVGPVFNGCIPVYKFP
jgi:hypothetical protein